MPAGYDESLRFIEAFAKSALFLPFFMLNWYYMGD